MNDKIILGIAGGTGSGKTSVAQIILEDLKKIWLRYCCIRTRCILCKKR